LRRDEIKKNGLFENASPLKAARRKGQNLFYAYQLLEKKAVLQITARKRNSGILVS
jgi:hypothetical protein